MKKLLKTIIGSGIVLLLTSNLLISGERDEHSLPGQDGKNSMLYGGIVSGIFLILGLGIGIGSSYYLITKKNARGPEGTMDNTFKLKEIKNLVIKLNDLMEAVKTDYRQSLDNDREISARNHQEITSLLAKLVFVNPEEPGQGYIKNEMFYRIEELSNSVRVNQEKIEDQSNIENSALAGIDQSFKIIESLIQKLDHDIKQMTSAQPQNNKPNESLEKFSL